MSSRPHPANWHDSRQSPAVASQSVAAAAVAGLRTPPSAAAGLLLAVLRHITTRRILLTLSILSVVIWATLASRAVKQSGVEGRLPRSGIRVVNDNDSSSSRSGRGGGRRGSPWLRSSRTMLRPRSSLWLPEYRNFTGELCDRLLRGDAVEQRSAREFTQQHRDSFWCYRDRLLANASCSRLFRAATAAAGLARHPAAAADVGAAGAPWQRSSFLSSSTSSSSSSGFSSAAYEPLPEELDFPLAFALRVHTCATQVELLLRAIYAPHNFYCLHADGGAAPEFLAAVRRLAQCLPNVVLAPVRDDFVYRSASQMESDVECMDAALRSPVKWRYFINMAGQELPLRSNYELVRRLRALNGSSHVNVMTSRSNANRFAYVHWCRDAATDRTVKCPSPLQRKMRPPGGARIRKSSAYGLYSRALVEFMRVPGGLGRRLYKWFADTMCPEEHYFATVASLPQAPGGYAAGSRTRAVKWIGSSIGHCRSGHYVRGVCIFGASDLPELISGGHAIANKFYFHEDPVAVRCLVDSVMRQKADPRRRLLKSPPPPPLWLSRQSAADDVQRSPLFGSPAGGVASADAFGAAVKSPNAARSIDVRMRPEADVKVTKNDKAAAVRQEKAAEAEAAEAYYRAADADEHERPDADGDGAEDNDALELVMAVYGRDSDGTDEQARPEADGDEAGDHEAREAVAEEYDRDADLDEVVADRSARYAAEASKS